jgi:predicted Zn-dependent peptidase
MSETLPLGTRLTTLANGVRVVSHHMPHLETIALGVWIATGARHERETEQGISHLLEHMAFKGTARRTARAIAEEIEQVGGDLNAATSLETTAYYARVLKGDEALALEILADILRNSLFADDDLVREKEVILQEIAGIKDSPEELAYDLIQEAAYPEQPVGRPIIGTPDSVNAITADDLRGFLAAHYRGPHLVISAAGAVDHDRLARHADALFGSLSGETQVPEVSANYQGGIRYSLKSFEQSHLLTAFHGPSYRDAGFYTAQVLSGVMGGGMSSRLFQEARENRGLCYSIYSSAWGLRDTGIFAIHAATGPAMMGELIDVVDQEFQRIAQTLATEREVSRAKAQLKAGMLMGLESCSARAEQMARQLLVAGRLIPLDEIIARVDDVTPEKIRALAASIMRANPASVAVVGAGKRSRKFAEGASRIGAGERAVSALGI